MRLKPLLYLISIQYKIQVHPLPLRPPFPLIGFRSHHGPLFPSLPLGFPPPRPFPHPGHPPPLAAASALVAAEHGKPLAAMLPPPAAAAGPPRPGPGHGAASLFSVLTSAASAGPAGGVAEAGSSLPDPSPDTNTEMTLKNNDSCEPEDPGNLHHCEDVQPPPDTARVQTAAPAPAEPRTRRSRCPGWRRPAVLCAGRREARHLLPRRRPCTRRRPGSSSCPSGGPRTSPPSPPWPPVTR